jgi:phosphohistidine phosphatase
MNSNGSIDILYANRPIMTTTELYLIRHGIAAERGTGADEERALTPDGIRKTQQVAQRWVELGLQFELILTSPLVRAQQTAEILKAVGLSQQLEVSDFLVPDGDFEAWFSWFEDWQTGDSTTEHRQGLAIVGHEPDLGEWAERLIWGEVRHQLVVKKAGIMGLNVPLDDPLGNSQLFWLAPPRLVL